MNTHKNARLTYLRRLETDQDMTERDMCASQAGAKHGVSALTARKWHSHYLVGGAQQLLDKSSRPARSPRRIEPRVAATIVELRRKLGSVANSDTVSKIGLMYCQGQLR